MKRLEDIGWKLGFYPALNWSFLNSRTVDVAWLYPIEALARLGVFAVFEVALSDMTNRKLLVASASDLKQIPAFLRALVAPVNLAKNRQVAEWYLSQIEEDYPEIVVIREDNLETTLTKDWIISHVQNSIPPLNLGYQTAKDGIVYQIALPGREASPLVVSGVYVPKYGDFTWLYMPEPFFGFLKKLTEKKMIGIDFDQKENQIVVGEGCGTTIVIIPRSERHFLFVDTKSEVSKILLEWARIGLAYGRKDDKVFIIPYEHKVEAKPKV